MTSFDQFLQSLSAVLKEQGYKRPTIFSPWFKGNHCLSVHYDSREEASVHLAVSPIPLNPLFPESPSDWWRNASRPYGSWLEEAGMARAEFEFFLGQQSSDGIRPPNFESLLSAIQATLPVIEEQVIPKYQPTDDGNSQNHEKSYTGFITRIIQQISKKLGTSGGF